MIERVTHKDQMGRMVVLKSQHKRIISLVPSQTELLYALGLNEEVIAQTLFCIHPAAQHKIKPRIGGTKTLNIAEIKRLNPDLIIGNKEENTKAQIEELIKIFPVWMSDIQNLDEALEMIIKIGKIVNRETNANMLVDKINKQFVELKKVVLSTSTCMYLIWRKPYMAAGKDTFIDDMLKHCGFQNVCDGVNQRYPRITSEQIKSLDPEFILLSSEPYPFKQKHIDELQCICPSSKIILVDGELFSWYGNRLLKSTYYFAKLRTRLYQK